MSKKLSLVLGCISILFLCSLISRNREIALLSIPLLIYVMIGMVTVPQEVLLDITREISAVRVVENLPVTVTLIIENLGGKIPRLQVLEPTFDRMKVVEGSFCPRICMAPGEKNNVTFTFTACRGVYQWQNVTLAVSDPFGLFVQNINIQAPGRVHVFPQQVDLRQFNFKPRPNVRTTGPNPSRLPGTGTEFWGVREYHPGDAMRTICWTKSARLPGKFMTKEFEREEIADIGFLLDARANSYSQPKGNDLFENSITATASLAAHFISQGNRVSMLILNDQLVRVFPGYGKHQLMHILEELSNCTLGTRVSFATLKYLPTKLFPNHSLITIISPLLHEDLPFILRLKAEGYQVLVATPEMPANQISDNSYIKIAQRITDLERAGLIKKIQRVRVPVIRWDASQPDEISKQFSRFAKVKPQ